MNISSQISWKLKAVAALVLVAIIAGAGASASWWLTKTAYQRDIATLTAEHANERSQWLVDKAAITTRAQQDTDAAMQRMKAAQDDLARLDAETQRKLADAEMENDSLSRDVATGVKRLRILGTQLTAAQRAASQHPAGGDSSAPGLGDGAYTELTAETGRAVLDLRAGIIRKEAQLSALQDYVEKVVKQCKR